MKRTSGIKSVSEVFVYELPATSALQSPHMSSRGRIHILNCGTMRPYLPPFPTGVTCLLVESSDGLVLVDTGFGTRDYREPGLGMRALLAAMRSPRDVSETAVHQVQGLGFSPESVHHIFMTHLHLDHAGGLPDFPWAQV